MDVVAHHMFKFTMHWISYVIYNVKYDFILFFSNEIFSLTIFICK
jgi:hypothetical protein